MEKTKAKLSIIKTRNSEFERYRSNLKTIWVRPANGELIWKGQHESAKVLEGYAKLYAHCVGCPVDFELRTGHGILVEFGSIK